MDAKSKKLLYLIGGVNALLLVCIVIVAVVYFSGGFGPPGGGQTAEQDHPAPASMVVRVQDPPTAQTGGQVQLVVNVANTGGDILTVSEIRLPKALTESAPAQGVVPQATGQVDYPDQTGYAVGFSISPGSAMDFTFTLQAKRALDFSGNVAVSAGSIQASAPLRVVIGAPAQPVAQSQPALPPSPSAEGLIPYHAIVQITAMYEDAGQLKEGWTGSGSIITPDGLILTNAHVALPDKYYPVDALVVSLTVSQDQPAVKSYYAEVVQADRALDFAVIRITTDLHKNPVDWALFSLPVVSLGDSDQLNLGDPITILGYPGIGGQTITLTRGDVSGFTHEDRYGDRAFIKTSATIAGGNSGGMAANARGELIGVPTQLGYGGEGQYVDCRVIADTNRDGKIDSRDSCVPTGGFINALRPVNLALPLIEAARRGEVSIVEPARPEIKLPKGGLTLFKDDFSNPKSGWDHIGNFGGSSAYRNGEYQIEIKEKNSFFGGEAHKSFTDGVITVKTHIVTPARNSDYGIICRFQDANNFYGFNITEAGYFAIWKVYKGEFSMLLDWDYTREIPKYQPVTLTAACIGNTLTIGVNGKALGQVTDATIAKGDIALMAVVYNNPGFVVAFDDLEVKSP
ncbi:MAG TPA: serine protease [Anaerolineaceae bacterium]|nr:serine protease [Anaerolineaceae bacterium]